MNPESLLATLPVGLREPLLSCYREIGANYIEHRWEPSELNGGKFCEVVYSILDGAISGKMPSKPSKPKNMLLACQELEKTPRDINRVGDRSLRILIPRALPYLYEIRNNRGVGHVGGEVDPNFLDATSVHSLASWILAELIRIFHDVSADQAQAAVNTLVERKNPLIWEIDGIRRVLDPRMKKPDQTLLLLYGQENWIEVDELFKWVEISTLHHFTKRIIEPQHKARLIEHDAENRRVRITPLGVTDVESRILKTRN